MSVPPASVIMKGTRQVLTRLSRKRKPTEIPALKKLKRDDFTTKQSKLEVGPTEDNFKDHQKKNFKPRKNLLFCQTYGLNQSITKNISLGLDMDDDFTLIIYLSKNVLPKTSGLY